MLTNRDFCYIIEKTHHDLIQRGNMLHFICNPISGNGKASKAADTIMTKLNDSDIPYEFHFSDEKGHATQIARELTEQGYKDIIVVGGDGTLHEVLNGLCDPKQVNLGLIASGSGNDLGGFVGIPKDPIAALDIILNGTPKPTDYLMCSGIRGINVLGTGVDVDILKRCYKSKILKGKFKYMISTLISVFLYKYPHATVTVDGKEYLTKEQLEAAVTNGELIIDSPYYEKGILPFSSQVSYTEIEGTPAVRYCVKEGHPGIFRYLITTFFVTKGERPVSATYFAQGMTASVQNESGISIAPAGVSGILNYVFRVILILLIIWAIHVLLVLATIFRVSPRHPRGRFMKIIVDAYAPNYNPKVEYTNVNVRTSTRFIYKRLFPFCFKTPQKDKGCGEMKMKVVDRDSFQFSIDSPDECIIYDSDRRISNPKGVRTLNEFIELVANREMPEYIDNLTNETLCDMFSHDHIVFEGGHAANLVVPGKPYPFTHDAHTPYLAFYSGNTLLYVVCFVPFTNQ